MVMAVAIVGLAVGIYAMTRVNKASPTSSSLDISVQTSQEGEPIRIVWGLSRPISGTLVACQEPPRIQKVKTKSSSGGGKGGKKSSSTVTTYVPHRTYAILVCEGPIAGFRRIWRNNKLVFDDRGTEWGNRNRDAFLKNHNLYLGYYYNSWPDPNLEAIFGVGNVPAMEGRAYMVAVDENLQDTNGAVPQWRFEVISQQLF